MTGNPGRPSNIRSSVFDASYRPVCIGFPAGEFAFERIRTGVAESWEGDLREPENVDRLFEQAEKTFGQVDILANNAAEYIADTFLPFSILGEKTSVWAEGPATGTTDESSHDRHFAVNSRAAALLMSKFAGRIIEKKKKWGRIINISADCAWGAPMGISYRASKFALES